ncbi:MAG: fused MFS/spermidine synthase [Chloroflexota bacterium]
MMPEPGTSTQRRMLYVAVFASGMTTLAVELSASRLLGNIFGTSNLVWANIIGLILIYLTLGYFIGGRLADRSPYYVTLYRLIAWGAFFSGLVPLIARPVLNIASQAVFGFQAGVAIGSFIAVLILFSVPVTLLGCVSPFAIRLALRDVTNAGQTAGRMYAISTLGSILGTFVPVFYLIPEAGTSRTFLYFAGLLIIVALVGLALHNRRAMWQLAWMPVLLLILALLTLNGPLRAAAPNTTLLYDKDSAYNYIQVTELQKPLARLPVGTRLLLLNEGEGIHSVWSPGATFYGGTWDMFMVAPFFNAPPYMPQNVKSLCIVGLAAGTIAHQYTAAFGTQVQIDGIEIDPEIVEVGRRFFDMNQPNLNVIIEDGRLALHQSTKHYDVVGIDAYRVPYVPWNLTTVEFFRDVRDHLNPQGVAVINVGRTVNIATHTQDRRLIEAMTHTMQQVFPVVHTIDVPNSFNTILIATNQLTDAKNLATNLAALPANSSPLLITALQTAVSSIKPTVASDVLFTDDRAPVETIINSMVIDYLLGSDPNQLTH